MSRPGTLDDDLGHVEASPEQVATSGTYLDSSPARNPPQAATSTGAEHRASMACAGSATMDAVDDIPWLAARQHRRAVRDGSLPG